MSGGPESSELIDVAAWIGDEEFPIFPVGSKPKRAIRCPATNSDTRLIAGHRYLFKISHGWRLYQHWSEVIAFRLASELGIPCAPCFPAIDSRTGDVGVLVEFFYGYPGENLIRRFIPGADLLRRVIRDFEEDSDSCHTWQNVQTIGRLYRQPDRLKWWGTLLGFDALIGNTDRHSENWGLLAAKIEEKRWELQMAPAFDHGTSMAYQVAEKDLTRAAAPEAINRFVAKGCHHLRLSSGKNGHLDVCGELAQQAEDVRLAIERVASIDLITVNRILEECSSYNLPTGICSEARVEFLFKLVAARKLALLSAIGSSTK